MLNVVLQCKEFLGHLTIHKHRLQFILNVVYDHLKKFLLCLRWILLSNIIYNSVYDNIPAYKLLKRFVTKLTENLKMQVVHRKQCCKNNPCTFFYTLEVHDDFELKFEAFKPTQNINIL